MIIADGKNVARRSTHSCLLSFPFRPHRPSFPFPVFARPIHTRVHPESHFYRPYHTHAYSYGCPRRLNYGLSSRARTTEESADRSRGELVALDARSVSLLFHFFSLSFCFLFSLSSRAFHDTRPEQAREQQSGCKRGGSVVSCPAAGTDSTIPFR